jgi:hypothetical protein
MAYSMTGPAFQKHWTPQKFTAAVDALRSRGKVAQYAPEGTCTERERGAYRCEYRVSYADGKSKKESLIIAKHDGGWDIASDPALAPQ